MKKLLLIDGNSLFHRAYHALPPITDKKGEISNAVFGFSNMLIKALNELKPSHVACAFDTEAPTFRHIEFEEYKAQRPVPPPDLYPQLPKVKKILDAFGVAYFEKEGYEADDVLATIASKVKSQKSKVKSMEVVILSGDRDCLQLVDGGVKVQMPGWNLKETTLYGEKEVREKYGLDPSQLIDYKALVGDPSDNIPGITGIGPKTAAQLLQKYGTLENLFKHLNELPEALAKSLAEGKKRAIVAHKLVTLDRNVDLGLSIENLKFRPDWEKAREEYEELGFKSIAAKLPGGNNTSEVGSPRAKPRGSDSSEVRSRRKSKANNQDQLKLV